jgi:hypothetical protein
MKIEITGEQEDEIICSYMQWILDNDSGSEHPEDIENWSRLQEAAKLFIAHNKPQWK